jgi:mRNA interferase MazF
MPASVLGAAQGSSGEHNFEVACQCGGYGRLEVRRGDVVTIVLPGAYGKPRPALVIQSDLFEALTSVTVLPVTSELRATPLLRIAVDPSTDNGLRKQSQVMVDKVQTVPRESVGSIIGKLQQDTLVAVERALAVFLGIA